ncbi:hypothetical protein F5X98DRAFT_329942 [Xylaria grammica]|nr:hypothetical protein F5X98DRAFT_329942 [Xylaria grammica]
MPRQSRTAVPVDCEAVLALASRLSLWPWCLRWPWSGLSPPLCLWRPSCLFVFTMLMVFIVLVVLVMMLSVLVMLTVLGGPAMSRGLMMAGLMRLLRLRGLGSHGLRVRVAPVVSVGLPPRFVPLLHHMRLPLSARGTRFLVRDLCRYAVHKFQRALRPRRRRPGLGVKNRPVSVGVVIGRE